MSGLPISDPRWELICTVPWTRRDDPDGFPSRKAKARAITAAKLEDYPQLALQAIFMIIRSRIKLSALAALSMSALMMAIKGSRSTAELVEVEMGATDRDRAVERAEAAEAQVAASQAQVEELQRALAAERASHTAGA